MYGESILNDSGFEFTTSLSPATKLVLAAASKKWSDHLGCDDSPAMVAAAFRVVAAQMIRTDDLTDAVEDEIRGAERQHQAGRLCAMAAELEGIA
jgi:hypothetical protein